MELLLECLHEVQDPMLYQMVTKEWGDGYLSLRFPSPVACLSVGYLLPQLLYPHVQLDVLDDQRVVLFTKGLSNGCVDRKQPRSGLSITLSGYDLRGRSGLQAIAQLLSSSYTISELVLDFVGSSMDPLVMLKCVGEVMATNTSIRSFELKYLFINSDRSSVDNPGPALRNMLERTKTLETLRLWYRSIGPYVASLAKGLVHNTSLKELVLYDCGVTDTGAKSLAEMIMSNTTLETLDICGNPILAEGVRHLAEGLEVNSTLHVLELDESVVCCNPESLAVALTVNTTLQRLDYFFNRKNRISRDAAEKLMDNGVLKKLLTIAIESTVNSFGWDWTAWRWKTGNLFLQMEIYYPSS